MDNLLKRCVIVLSNDDTLHEKDIYDRLSKVQEGLVEQVLSSGDGRWLVVFSAGLDDAATNLQKIGSFHIETAENDRVRKVTATVAAADMNTVNSVYLKLQESDKHSATRCERLTVDYVTLRNQKPCIDNRKTLIDCAASTPKFTLRESEKSDERTNSSDTSDVTGYSSSQASSSGIETSQKLWDSNNAAFGYLEFRYLSSDTAFLKKLLDLYGVKVHFKFDDEAPQMEVEGPNMAAALMELQQKVQSLVTAERQVNAARVWLLSRSAVAADLLQQKLAQNGITISWFLGEFQMGEYHLLNSFVTVTLCAQHESAFDEFCTILGGLFQEETRSLSETVLLQRWDTFLADLSAKLRNEFYAQSDLQNSACTFLALPGKMPEILAAFNDIDNMFSRVVHIISADNVRLRYLQEFCSKELIKLQERDVKLTFLPDRLECTGGKASVEAATEKLLQLLKSIKCKSSSYQSQTLARLFKMEGVLQDLQSRNNCIVELNSASSSELLRYKIGRVTLVVRCADILDNETQVVASFTDVKMSAIGTVRPKLLQAAGAEVLAECRETSLKLGNVKFTKSGNLANYSVIAHLCVSDSKASSEQVAVAHQSAIRCLLLKMGIDAFSSVTFAMPAETVYTEVLSAVRECAMQSTKDTEIHFVNPEFDVVDQFATLVCFAFGVRRSSNYPIDMREARQRGTVLEEYHCVNGLSVTLCIGDLGDTDAALVTTVSSTDDDLLETDDVSASVLRKAGGTNLDELRLSIRAEKSLKVAVTKVTSLPHCRVLAHALLPPFVSSRSESAEKLLRTLVRNVVKTAGDQKLHSVAFGPVGCGRLQYDASTVAETMLTTLLKLDAKRKVRPPTLAVKIVLPKADRELQSIFSNAFQVRVKPAGGSRKMREVQYIRVDKADEEVLCKAQCCGLKVLLVCSHVLSHVAQADALLHPVGHTACLDEDVSTILATVANCTNVQLQLEIDRAPSKFNIKYSTTHSEKTPYSCILHAKFDDNEGLNVNKEAKVIEDALRLCDDKGFTSCTIPVGKTRVDWPCLIGAIGKIAKQKLKRLGTVKLVSTADHLDAFLSATSRSSATSKAARTRRNSAVAWYAQICHAKMKFDIVHMSQESLAGAIRDMEMLICNGEEFLKQQVTSPTPPQTPVSREFDEAAFPAPSPLISKQRPHTIFDDLPDLEVIESERLTLSRKVLGKGYFGEVRIGVFKEYDVSYEVAVKLVFMDTNDDANDLVQEAKLMSKLSHPNIVKILGLTTNENHVMIVMELVKLTSLLKYVQNQAYQIDEPLIISWMKQVADGMAYLGSKQVIHRDLAARNILLDSETLCKISDFGLSHRLKHADDIYLMKRLIIPVRWYPPECLSEVVKVFVQKSDIWSYGVLMWETYSMGEVPYSDSHPQITSENICLLVNYLVRGKRLAQPANCCEKAYAIMKQCWQIDAQKRLSFLEIAKSLEDIANSA